MTLPLRHILTASLALICFSINAERTILADEHVQNALKSIYNLDYKKTEAELQNIAETEIQSYLVEYKSIMQYATNNNKSNYEAYMKASNKAIDAVGKHAYRHNLLCNLRLHRCLVEMSNGNLLTSGIQFWRAYGHFKDGEKEYADYEGQLKLRGVFNILLSQIPEKWQGMASLLGFIRGDLALGLEQLNSYYRKVEGIKGAEDESLLLSFANMFMSHEQYLSPQLAAKMKQNATPMVSYIYVLAMGKKRDGAEADSIFGTIAEQTYGQFALLSHQRAKFALRRLDADGCLKYSDDFLRDYKGEACVNNAYLLKSYAYALKGNRKMQVEMAQKAIETPFSSDVDRRTHNDAARATEIDVTLLKCQLLFEYGDIEQCRQTIKDYYPEKEKDFVEYHFRKGRILEAGGNTDEAEKHYEKCVEKARNDKQYYGPYAAIYLADIHLKKGQNGKARTWLSTAKKLNNGEHQKEIDQRIAITLIKTDNK